ncbi:MAG TPA: hypothetical protein VF633_06600 [Brevundimonas sp.]
MTSDGGMLGRRLNIAVWCGAVCLWLLPLVAMQFTREVAWTTFDFIVWGLMLVVAAGAFELATRMSGNIAYRLGAGLALAASFFMVWVNLAVGIIGNENEPLNLMFFGVLLIGVLGSVAVMFRARGMIWTMLIMAIAQGVVAVVAQVYGHFIWPISVAFTAVWLTSAWLFKRAAETRPA